MCSSEITNEHNFLFCLLRRSKPSANKLIPIEDLHLNEWLDTIEVAFAIKTFRVCVRVCSYDFLFLSYVKLNRKLQTRLFT